jgi:hypothetical protein
VSRASASLDPMIQRGVSGAALATPWPEEPMDDKLEAPMTPEQILHVLLDTERFVLRGLDC